jgi:hypothetical protein
MDPIGAVVHFASASSQTGSIGALVHFESAICGWRTYRLTVRRLIANPYDLSNFLELATQLTASERFQKAEAALLRGIAGCGEHGALREVVSVKMRTLEFGSSRLAVTVFVVLVFVCLSSPAGEIGCRD